MHSSEKPSPINLDTDPKKDLAAIHHLCVTYEKSLTALLPKQVSTNFYLTSQVVVEGLYEMVSIV